MNKFCLLLLFVGWTVSAQKQIPDLSLNNLEGKSISLKNNFAEKDKLYVFSFWATWCTPCISELDELNEVQEDWKKSVNFEVIAISTDDTRTQKRVKPLINGKGWDYQVLLDTNQDFKRAMSIVNIPYTIVVKNGEIVHIQNGYVPGNEKELLEKLKTL
ncbi:TlpA family protein disulfide reductase [Flavobacterium sp. CYK-4]|uniref:TlpA family protein disulfide reductase n=1 Tax=Flavobacterium lotistagni TaxID=2709660 RepID=UPI00140CF2AB|nr:TlpA disulfide reductase family protein [Flavobacterium lotistagni]NHM05952.1 TlpA family protein disulfide reductase [Flavobacterium lotistagni]